MAKQILLSFEELILLNAPLVDKLSSLLNAFPSLPFLFVGTGLSIRYLNAPTWEELLRRFASLARPGDEAKFAFEIYKNRAIGDFPQQLSSLPQIASLIETDFNNQWYTSPQWQSSREKNGDLIQKQNLSPFKLEIANYFKELSHLLDHNNEEVLEFKKISQKNIAGVITTNYDMLMQLIFDEFTTYIGQDELLFSSVQGIGEIYKIHGCCQRPDSIIINGKDYQTFSEKNVYLAAKLITYFVEHPVVFLGYSLSDPNIRQLLSSLVKAFNQTNIQKLCGRLFFVERVNAEKDEAISEHTIDFESGNSITMIKVQVCNFSNVYTAINSNKSKYPVRYLRQIKEDLCEFVTCNNSTEKIKMIGLEDNDNDNDSIEYVIGVGVINSYGEIGFRSIKSDELFVDIVLGNQWFNKKEYHHKIITETLPALLPHYPSLPMHKYLQAFNDPLPEKVAKHYVNSYDGYISSQIIKTRHAQKERSIASILENDDGDLLRSAPKIARLSEHEVVVEDLKQYLMQVFKKYPNILATKTTLICSGEKTDIRRLIKIYDWLKYHKPQKPRKKKLLPATSSGSNL